MSTKTTRIIILAFVLLVIIGAFLFFFFVLRDKNPNNNQIPSGGGQTFFPVTTTFDNGSPSVSGNNSEQKNNISTAQNNEFVPRLRQISKVPTAGAVTFERDATSSDLFIEASGSESQKTFKETIFRFIERSTGHLFEATEKNLTQTRLSNVTIPKIQEAYFDTSGNSVLLRYLGGSGETIETFVGSLVEATTTNANGNIEKITKIEGGFLEENIDNLTVFGNSINYLKKTEEGSDIFTTTFKNTLPRKMFSLSTSQWLLGQHSQNSLTMTTKADSRAPGFMFRYDISTGRLFQILEDINGLTTLTSPSGKYVLLSQSRGSDLNLVVYDTGSNAFRRMNIQTLPEKCVWSTKEESVLYCGAPDFFSRTNYPESWYQGIVSFDDSIWKIDVKNNTYQNILQSRSETDQAFDIIKPILSPNDEYFVFINKNDLTLWSLDLVTSN